MWLVCFTGRIGKDFWWDKIGLTRREFRHCYVVQYQPDVECWVLVDWRTGVCDVVAFKHHEMDYILGHLEAVNGTALLVKQEIPKRNVQYRVPLIYCVQAVLQIIGLPTKWTFTPKQLYKRLIDEGCEELINHRSDSDGQQKQTKDRSNDCKNKSDDAQAARA